MTERQRFEQLVAYSTSENRICPKPIRWDQLWQLLGRPSEEVGPPLVLSGWAFSSDRDKRVRFKEHLEYALRAGIFEVAETFLRELEADEWHTGDESRLDWSYGNALIEDEATRQKATMAAARLLASDMAGNDILALGPNVFAEMLLLYYLIGGDQDYRTKANEMKQQFALFAKLDDDGEFSLLDGANGSVATQLRQIREARRNEYLLAEFLVCIECAGRSFDRDAIEDFTADAFDTLQKITM